MLSAWSNTMAEIIGIRFKREGKQYYFDPKGLQVRPGTGVILETSWGIEFGECIKGNSQVPDSELVAPLRPIVRIATEADRLLVEKNRAKEKEAFSLCQQKISEHGLDMKLVDVEYSFEGNKILFFFTSEGRVDFRGLVKDLASIFHTRIELRQIGVRDEAKMLGGLGICGRPFCCASFLREFQPVSIKMAKTQSLSLNPTKISGTCGRLMCCLKYEQNAYEDLLKTSPRSDSFVETPDGVGDIISVNTLRETVRVRLDDESDTLKTYHNTEIRVVRSGKGRRPEDYTPPPKSELSKLRRAPAPGTKPESSLAESLNRLLGEAELSASDEAAPASRRREDRGERNRGRGRGGKEGSSTRDGGESAEKGGPQRRNRNRKSTPQTAMQKALPQEKSSPAPIKEKKAELPSGEGKEKKSGRGGYWRKRGGNRGKGRSAEHPGAGG